MVPALDWHITVTEEKGLTMPDWYMWASELKQRLKFNTLIKHGERRLKLLFPPLPTPPATGCAPAFLCLLCHTLGPTVIEFNSLVWQRHIQFFNCVLGCCGVFLLF